MPSLFIVLLARQYQPPKSWYGPGEVTFNIQYAGNPYDAVVNDAKVHFVSDTGVTADRPAYFAHGGWHAVLTAPLPGHYKSTLFHNGRKSMEEAIPSVLVLDQKTPHGFVQRDKFNANRLAYDDERPAFPFGFDLATRGTATRDLVDEIAKMGQAGLTWTTLTSDEETGTDPWWPNGDAYAVKDQLWPQALDRCSDLVTACDSSGLDFQFVLFSGVALEDDWVKNPWNKANGGFMQTPGDFFTNPEAKRREELWIRYAVARWGGDPHLFVWQLFDAAGWATAVLTGQDKAIHDWHKEMSDYIRSIDPYGHAITTGHQSLLDIWGPLDINECRLVDDSLPAKVEGLKFPKDTPAFISYFEPVSDQGAHEGAFINTVIWQSLRQNRAAPAMYGDGSGVFERNLLPRFQIWAEIVAQSALAFHPMAAACSVTTSTGQSDGIRDINWVLLRLRGADGKAPKLSWLGMIDGTWKATIFNLKTGDINADVAHAAGAFVQLSPISGQDVVVSMQVGD